MAPVLSVSGSPLYPGSPTCPAAAGGGSGRQRAHTRPTRALCARLRDDRRLVRVIWGAGGTNAVCAVVVLGVLIGRGNPREPIGPYSAFPVPNTSR